MRSLPNVIKPTQYVSAVGTICTGETIDLLSVADTYITEARGRAEEMVEAAEQRGQKIVEQARREAEKIIEEGKLQAKKAYEDGFVYGKKDGLAKGFDEGYGEGLARAEQDMAEQAAEFRNAVGRMIEARDQVIAEEERRFPALIAEVAQTVINRDLSADIGVLSGMIQQNVCEYRNRDWVNIYVSLKVFERLKQPECNFISEITNISPGAQLFACRAFDEDDCVIEFENEIVDISVKTQLAKIKSALSKQRG